MTWWATQPTLQALVTGGLIWHLEAAENADVEPYVTFFRVSEVPVTWTTGYAFRETVVQFNVHHFQAATAESIAYTIASALASIPGPGATLTIHGVSSISVLPDSFNTQIGEGLGTGGRDCWLCSFEVTIQWAK